MSLIKKLYGYLRNYYYSKRDKIIIPPYEEKREIILSYKKKFDTNIFVETGTFLGDTINQFKSDFTLLFSFELSKELAEKASARFNGNPKIKIIQGDSGKLLTKLITDIQEPCLFWLDGHYSSEFFVGEEFIRTAKGEKETPILEELKAILTHNVKKHVILIDDARCFTGKNDYPTISYLKKYVRTFNQHVKIEKKRDIIRITPVN